MKEIEKLDILIFLLIQYFEISKNLCNFVSINKLQRKLKIRI